MDASSIHRALCACVPLGACAVAAPAQGAASASPAPQAASDASGYPVHGSLSWRFRARFTDGASDQDLVETLTLDAGDARRNALTLHLSADARVDLDGRARSTFTSLDDTFGSAFDERLYEAYADVQRAGEFELVRLGRQSNAETPLATWFDGLRLETREFGAARVRLGAWGGVPVRIYEAQQSGDLVCGAFAEARPWSDGRVRLDWMHAADDARLSDSSELFGLGLWQGLGPNLRLEGQYTRLEAQDRDVRLRASWIASDSDLVVQASWYRLLQTQGELAVPFDPFDATLHDLHPYEQYTLLVSRSLGAHLALQAGYDARRVVHESDQGAFNHDFDRGWATLGVKDVLPAGLELSLTGERWDSPQTDLRTLGAELARHFGARVEGSLGTSYALYRYDLDQQRELDHVRLWYLRWRWNLNASTRLELRYEIEDDPLATYDDLRLGATWRF